VTNSNLGSILHHHFRDKATFRRKKSKCLLDLPLYMHISLKDIATKFHPDLIWKL